MELPLLRDIVIILGFSVVIILVFKRLKLPEILGFLIAGIIAGPYGLNIVHSVHEVELLAEIGVIFLLFVIGIEFSLKGLAAIRNTVLFGGAMQVGGTIILVTLICIWMGMSLQSAVFMGFLLSLSSTAIVLKMLQEKGELMAPYGRVSIGILIFQDIVVVLMMLLTPLLAGQMEDPGMALLILLGKVVAIVAAVILLARYLVPVLFSLVVRAKSKELFILLVVVLCFSTAWLTSAAGLSLALGAFFAGLIISESEYSHQANANILPFREIFISFFFVSVGMLLDISFFVQNIGYILLISLAVILLKMLVISLTVFLLRYPARTIILSSLALFQVGEFAFVLSTVGMRYDLLSQSMYQYFLSISIITMGITPFLIKFSPAIVRFLLRTPIPPPVLNRLQSIAGNRSEESLPEESLHDHLVIIGYGINGQNVARTAKRANIPYVIVELDPDMIRLAKEKKHPIIYGDATNEAILKHVYVQNARVVVVAISDPEATEQIVNSVRLFTETAYIIVRTRYVREMERILQMGADEVIPEEFETSIEIFTRVLKKYLVPNDEIQGFVNDIRSRNYEMLRSVSGIEGAVGAPLLHIPDMEIATLPVQQGKNDIVGKTIGEAGIRSRYGITVLAIKRGEEYITDISTEVLIKPDDVLYIFGPPDNILRINKYFKL